MSSEIDDLVVYADAVRMEQIIWNMVSNAVKFTPAHGRIAVRLARDGACARLEVSDTGIGIDSETIDHVFDMFKQGERPVTTRRDGGLGIGLALVKQLSELHDGRVEARSEGRGKGATFLVWLPLFEGRLGSRKQAVGATLYGQRVLLVEDDPDTLHALCDILTTEGAVVTVASNAHEALEQADIKIFDLVISDIAMPGTDGLQLIRELRRRPRSARWPAIAVSGFGGTDDTEMAKAAGFDDHLAKPLSIDTLHEAFARLCHKATP